MSIFGFSHPPVQPKGSRLKSEQVPYFTEYCELRKDSEVNAKRISELEGILVEMNRGLIFCVVRIYPVLRNYPKEAEVVGYAAILDALRDYDPTRSSFCTHAGHQLRASWSLQALARFYMGGPLNIPHNAYSNYRRDRESLRQLVESGVEPSVEESEAIATMEAMESALNGVCTIHGTAQGEGGMEEALEQSTFEPPSFSVESREFTDTFLSAIDTLPTRERHVIVNLFGLETGEGKSLKALGLEMNMSHENVRKIRDKAYAKLKRITAFANLA